MNRRYLLLAAWLVACNNNSTAPQKRSPAERTEIAHDTVRHQSAPDTILAAPDTLSQKTYANERFKNVKLEQLDKNSFRVTGKAQIFEARFGWVIEDGHRQLAEGFVSADAGAPAWGNFAFTFRAPAKSTNSTQHLILFESSAKDGSRQHELPIPLP